MSATIEAGLRLQIADYQAGLAAAKAETQKFKQDLINKGADLDKKLFEQIEKHKLDLSRARKEVEDIRAMFKAKGEKLEKDFFEKFEKHKLDITKIKEQLKNLREGGGGRGGSVLGDILGANLITGAFNKGAGVIDEFIRRGVAFNATMDNSQVGIANLLKKFDGLNDAAAKDEAAKAMARIVELEPVTAGSLQDLTMGFMTTLAAAKGVGFTTEQNVQMTAKFANALANAGLQADQLAQEYRSILSGNITSDSQLAKILGITNEDVNQIKASGGDLFAFLEGKLGEMAGAGDSAAVAWSSFQSALDKAAGDFAKGFFDQGIAAAKDLAVWLAENKTLFADLGQSASSGMALAVGGLKKTLDIVKEIKAWLVEPGKTKARMDDIVASTKSPPRNPADVYTETTATGSGDSEAAKKDKAAADRETLIALNARRGAEGLLPLKELPKGKGSAAGGTAGKSGGSGSGSGGGDANDGFDGRKNRFKDAAKNSAAAALKERLQKDREGKAADDKLQQTRDKLQSEKQRDAYDSSDLAGKIKIKKGEVNQAGKNATLAGEGGFEQDKLDAMLEQNKAQRELNALLKEQDDNAARLKEKMEAERDAFKDKLEKQKQSKQSLLEELAIAGAKQRGDKAAVEAMEKEKKIRDEARRIHEAVGGDPRAARRSAELLFGGDSGEGGGTRRRGVRDDGARYIDGVQAKHYMGGRSGPLSTETGMLTSRHARNTSRSDAAESAAANSDRDPGVDVLKQMLTLWKEQIGQ